MIISKHRIIRTVSQCFESVVSCLISVNSLDTQFSLIFIIRHQAVFGKIIMCDYFLNFTQCCINAIFIQMSALTVAKIFDFSWSY